MNFLFEKKISMKIVTTMLFLFFPLQIKQSTVFVIFFIILNLNLSLLINIIVYI